MGVRLWIAIVGMLLVVAACGKGSGGATATSEAPPTTAAESAPAVDAAATEVGVSEGGARTGSLVLLADDFQDGDAADWDIHNGWFIHGLGGEYVLAASDSAWAWWADGDAWEARYVLRASARVDAGGLAVSAAVGPEGRYVFHFHEEGTDLLLDRPWGTLEPLVSGQAIELGVWHALAIGVDGGLMQLYADGTPLLQYRVSDPLTHGSIGFGALDHATAAIDNVLVNVLQGALPTPPFPQASLPGQIDSSLAIEDPLDDAQPADGAQTMPDLELVGVEFDKARYSPGEPITVSVLVRSASAHSVGPFSVAWVTEDAGCTAEIATIAPGESSAGRCTSAGLPENGGAWQVFVDDDERVSERNEANNIGWGSLEISGVDQSLPNLASDGHFFLHHARGDLGESLSMHAPYADVPFGIGLWVDDLNAYPAEIGTYTVRFTVDGQWICSVDLDGVDPEFIPETCEHPGLPSGPHLLEAVIDVEGDIPETREDDNRYTHEFVVEFAAQPETVDLYVDLVSFDPGEPTAGEDFEVTIWVGANPSTGGDLADYTVSWILEQGGKACEWGVTVRSGGLRCVWHFDTPGTYRWRARIDATNTVAESNEDNNVLRGSVTVGQ